MILILAQILREIKIKLSVLKILARNRQIRVRRGLTWCDKSNVTLSAWWNWPQSHGLVITLDHYSESGWFWVPSAPFFTENTNRIVRTAEYDQNCWIWARTWVIAIFMFCVNLGATRKFGKIDLGLFLARNISAGVFWGVMWRVSGKLVETIAYFPYGDRPHADRTSGVSGFLVVFFRHPAGKLAPQKWKRHTRITRWRTG